MLSKNPDKMTPKERMRAFSKGEPMDRIPIVPDMGVTMAWYIGARTYDYYHDPKVLAQTEIELFKRFFHDSVSVSTTLRGMAEAMGSKIAYTPNGLSQLEEALVKKPEDIKNLKPINPHKDGLLHVLMEALEIIREAIGDVADIGASMTAPFSVAASILGAENLLKWTRREPEALKDLMEIITLNNKSYIIALSEKGFSTSFCCPVSSTTLISKKQFQEFSLPYLSKNIDDVHELCGSKPTLHICGKSKDLWLDCVDSGIGNFSIDNIEDLTEAKEMIGDRCIITGNVPPVEVMYLGTEEDVFKSVKTCIDKAINSPCGYILSTGCQIPMNTKIENIDAFMEAGREYGKL